MTRGFWIKDESFDSAPSFLLSLSRGSSDSVSEQRQKVETETCKTLQEMFYYMEEDDRKLPGWRNVTKRRRDGKIQSQETLQSLMSFKTEKNFQALNG